MKIFSKIVKQRGFTLIELLVVISIIGLLSTLAVVALNSARMKARDARRVADVKQIRTALELFYNDNNSYPTALGTSIVSGATTYMTTVPTNPTPVLDNAACTGNYASYTYAVTGTWPNITSYSLNYCLGGTTGGILLGTHQATPSGIQ